MGRRGSFYDTTTLSANRHCFAFTKGFSNLIRQAFTAGTDRDLGRETKGNLKYIITNHTKESSALINLRDDFNQAQVVPTFWTPD